MRDRPRILENSKKMTEDRDKTFFQRAAAEIEEIREKKLASRVPEVPPQY